MERRRPRLRAISHLRTSNRNGTPRISKRQRRDNNVAHGTRGPRRAFWRGGVERRGNEKENDRAPAARHRFFVCLSQDKILQPYPIGYLVIG
jgi:hypothetical protein